MNYRKREEIKKLKSEIKWSRAYGSFINCYHKFIDAEASDYADKEEAGI